MLLYRGRTVLLGLFDSGRGGLNTVRHLKNSGDDLDLIYLIDINNSPYGIKTEKEIIEIATHNIKTLSAMGAEKILIACCTAGTVHPYLDKECREISIPIISEVADRARTLTRYGRVGVIATEHTVRSHAFSKALSELSVTEMAASELVTLIDGGLCDATAKDGDVAMLEKMLRPILDEGIDTLILGCTHFPALSETIDKIAKKYGDIRIVDSARAGADALRKYKSQGK